MTENNHTFRGNDHLVRFELDASEPDRDLLLDLSRTLAKDEPVAEELRNTLRRALSNPDQKPRRGGILAALLNSPFAGSDLDLRRPRELGRPFDL